MALLFNGRACEPLLVPADLQLAWARTLRECARLIGRTLDRPAHANGRSPYLWSWSRIIQELMVSISSGRAAVILALFDRRARAALSFRERLRAIVQAACGCTIAHPSAKMNPLTLLTWRGLLM